MGSEWKTVHLGDHVDACLGKMLDQNKNQGTLYPYLGNKQVRWGSFNLEDLSEMKFEDHEHERYGLRYGDLVVCEGGEPGRCALWKDEVQNMKIQKALHRIRPNPELDSTFLHYWFCYAGKFELLEPYFTGTTIQHLTGKAIAKLPIPLPPLPEQKAIAHILGTLDDKIELNRRMNATLEGMAQALFKSWFVDFDPVIDNALAAGNPIPDELADRAEVRRQALANGTANREAAKPFPAAFQETESMGWIPEGWKTGAIEDFCDLITSGGTPARMKNEYWEGGNICWFKTGELLDGPLLESKEKITQVGLDNSSCKLWPAGTILFALYASPTVGRLGVLTQAATANQAAAALIAKPSIGVPFLKQLLLVARSSIQDIAVGSAQQNINQKILKTHRVIKPSDKTAKAYSDHVLALSQQIEIRIKQTQSLAKLRDTLLPKLISGELRIPEAEQLTEEALA